MQMYNKNKTHTYFLNQIPTYKCILIKNKDKYALI